MWWEQEQTRSPCSHRVVRQPAQVRPDRPPGEPQDAGAHSPRGAQRGGQRAAASIPRRSHPACHQGGAVRAGGDHRHAELRRADGATALLSTRGRPRAGRWRSCRTSAARACSPPTPAPTSGSTSTIPRAETRQRLSAMVAAGSWSTARWTPRRPSRRGIPAVIETLGTDADGASVIALVLRTGATGDLSQAVARRTLPTDRLVVLNEPRRSLLSDAKGGGRPPTPIPRWPHARCRARSGTRNGGRRRGGPCPSSPTWTRSGPGKSCTRSSPGSPPAAGCPSPSRRAARLYRIPMVPPGSRTPRTTRGRAAGGRRGRAQGRVPGLTHKTDAGAVLLDLRTEVACGPATGS